MKGELDGVAPSRRSAMSILTAGGWLATVIYSLQSILLIPLFLKHIGSELYGLWLASGGVLVWLAMADFGISAFTTQRCGAAYGRGDLASVVAYFKHGATITLALMLVVILLGMLIGGWVPEIFGAGPDFGHQLRQAFWVATVTVAVSVALEFLRGFAAALQRVGRIVVAGIVGDLLAIAVTVVGLFASWGLLALAAGGLVRFLVPVVVALHHAVSLCRTTGKNAEWSREIFLDFRHSAPPLLTARATGQAAQGMPAILIGHFLGGEATVVYSVSIRAVQVAELLFTQALIASSGAISHLQGGGDRAAFLCGLSRWAVVIAALAVFPLAMCAGANSGFVALWVGAEHYAGQGFTLLAVSAGLAAGALRSLQHLSFNLGATEASARLWTVEHMLRAALIAILIPLTGVHGAPLATFLAVVFVAPAAYRLARHSIGPWGEVGSDRVLAGAARLAAVVALAALVSPWLPRDTWFQWISGCVALAIAAAVALLVALPELRGEVVLLLRHRRLVHKDMRVK